MGQAGSITAKALIHPLLRVFTQWEEARINELFLRARSDLSDTFALRFGEFQHLLNRELVNFLLARDIFNEIFDTDRNLMVDKFEVVAAALLLSKLSTQKKVEYMHKLFDFNEKGYLTHSEASLMMITVVNTSHKADGRPPKPGASIIELLLDTLFGMYTRDPAGKQILPSDLVSYCANTADVRGYLEFWRGVASQVLLPDGLRWRDPWFPAAQLSITPTADWLAHGFPPKDFVEWRRRKHVGVGCTRLFTHTTWKLKDGKDTPMFSGPGAVGRGKLQQGFLADRWILNAIACVISRPQSLSHLFSFTGQEDVGRFCCRIYEGGGWRTLFVDDRLPCSSDGTHLFSSSSDPTEFWVPLLSKCTAKYLKSYSAVGMCSLRPDASEMALRWLTGGHVTKACTEDFDWKSLASECNGQDGMAYLERLVEEGAIVALGRSETRVLTRFTMEPAPYEGPPHGRLFPVIGFAVEAGYRQIILRDTWGKDKSLDKNHPPDESSGHSRLFKLNCETLPQEYDTIIVCRFIDSLKDAAVSGEYRHPPWRTLTMQGTTHGAARPCTLRLTVPAGQMPVSNEVASAQKKARSEFGRELTLAQTYAQQRKERQRLAREEREETELDRVQRLTTPIELSLTASALQDWGIVGSARVDMEGKMKEPEIRLRIVPTAETVTSVHHALRREHEITEEATREERLAKEKKLKELKEGKSEANANPHPEAQAQAEMAALGGLVLESSIVDEPEPTGTTEDASVPGAEEGVHTGSEVNDKGDPQASGANTALVPTDTAADAKDAGSSGSKEGAAVVPEKPKRLFRRGLDSRDGLTLSPSRHAPELVTAQTPWAPDGVDPVPEVSLAMRRSWLSHTLKLYPGEYAVYVDVTYNVGRVSRDLRFDFTGELGERPWEESELTTEEITGEVKRTAGELDARPKKVWCQFSSQLNFDADVCDREAPAFSGDVVGMDPVEERWPFMAESQSEAATSALVQRMASLHTETLSCATLLSQAAKVAKRKNDWIKTEAK